MKVSSKNMNNYRPNQKIHQALVETRALWEGPYDTSAGLLSPIGGNFKALFTHPRYFKVVTKELGKICRKYKIDYILGGAVTGIPFATAVAYEIGAYFGFIRKQKHFHAGKRTLGGQPLSNYKNAAIIDDSSTTWGNMRSFIKNCQREGIKIKYIIVIVDMIENPKFKVSLHQYLKKNKLRLIYLTRMKDVMGYYYRKRLISKEFLDFVIDFLAYPETWTKDSLKVKKFLTLYKKGAIWRNKDYAKSILKYNRLTRFV